MIDLRFYEVPQPLSASGIAALLGAAVSAGDPARMVSSLAPAASASASDLAFVEEARDAARVKSAGVCLTSHDAASAIPDGPAVIIVPHPRAAFAQVADQLVRLRTLEAGAPAIHPTARIAPTAILEPGVVVGAGAAIGAGVAHRRQRRYRPRRPDRRPHGHRRQCQRPLRPDRRWRDPLSRAVIGEAGFGLAAGGAGARLTPHFGRVIIQNGVSIGASSCIDRGLLEDTVIGEGTHIDNLCHIGHNCRIGSHVVMAAFAGVSGSVPGG